MGSTVVQRIIEEHLVEGELEVGKEIGIKIDQTLTQDATGTLAYLQFEALGIPRVKTNLSVSYVDHNTQQTGFENADDHLYLQTVAAKYGIYFSKPGNGISHQVNLERFSVPGRTLLGSDSHTPTAGGAGMLAIGAGGLDVAVTMGGGLFYMKMPKIVGVKLTGRLKPWVSAMDVILELLRRLTVKGGVGRIMEYYGEGITTLSVPERATITNMGAELGATTSIFPSDEVTRGFLISQDRGGDWTEIKADPDAEYDEEVEINLSELEPLIAKPHSPDNVVGVGDVEGLKVQQVIIGSCTNSSYRDLMIAAKILEGEKVHPDVSLAIAPGSRQVLEMIARNGALATFIRSGARILESACGPCIGMGQAPPTNGVSIRTFNRNFEGRSGTKSAQVYLASPEVASASAIEGAIADPRELGDAPVVEIPEKFWVDVSMILPPAGNPNEVAVMRGPNIAPLPKKDPLPDDLSGEILLKVGDYITTDHIMPAGSRILPLRSNIPKISQHVFEQVDPTFSKRAKEKGGGFIVGGENYGQGSSREHAALASMYLGIKAVIAKSFARIHKANLINFGILPLEFSDGDDYGKMERGDEMEIKRIGDQLRGDGRIIEVFNRTKNTGIKTEHDLSERQVKIVVAGGLLNFTRETQRKG
ncbi:MAG: aconitate hydratase [Candidatus Hydrothermarchaeales archaeon]